MLQDAHVKIKAHELLVPALSEQNTWNAPRSSRVLEVDKITLCVCVCVCLNTHGIWRDPTTNVSLHDLITNDSRQGWYQGAPSAEFKVETPKEWDCTTPGNLVSNKQQIYEQNFSYQEWGKLSYNWVILVSRFTLLYFFTKDNFLSLIFLDSNDFQMKIYGC